ncbi:competence protein ComK [Lactiplantibacillus modestisalitolerans]|uniref:Competence protein ComK n=1 Tax=Lactiplantibacillus modestisalitolerans TaxID=1457219 RepID=A0ABV5WUD2_9LACO|nr:competence protein ComK [Lactiplantibacillus modestisalitolerans]
MNNAWNELPNYINLLAPLSMIKFARCEDHVTLQLSRTILLLDISNHSEHYQALIFDTERGLMMTPQSTNQLIRQVQHNLHAEQARLVRRAASELGHSNRKLPIVHLKDILMPLTATSRGKTSWLNLRFLTGTAEHADYLALYLENGLTLRTDFRRQSFKQQVRRAEEIAAHVQKQLNRQPSIALSQCPAPHALPVKLAIELYMAFGKAFCQYADLPYTDKDILNLVKKFLGGDGQLL